MTKTDKARPGTAGELAEMFPAPKQLPVRITRVTGAGAERKVEIEESTVTVYALPIEQLGRIVGIFEPVLTAMTEPKRFLQFISDNKPAVYAAVAEATGWSVADVAAFNGDDFMTVVFAIIEANNDFFGRLLALAGFGSLGIPAGSNGAGPGPSPTFAAGEAPIPSDTRSPSLPLQ